MLISTISGPGMNGLGARTKQTASHVSLGCVGCAPRFSGGLGGASGITALQQQLTAYAQGAGTSKANPCSTSGSLDNATVQAAIYVATKIPGLSTIKSKIIDRIPGFNMVTDTLFSLPCGAGLSAADVAIQAIAGSGGSNWLNDVSAFINSNASTIATGIQIYNATKGYGVNVPNPMNQLVSMTPVFRSPIPTGSIQTFDAKSARWLIATPVGLGMFGSAPTHVFRAELSTASASAGARTVTNSEFAKATGGQPGGLLPWYKTTLGMIGLGVGAAAVLGGGYYAFIR